MMNQQQTSIGAGLPQYVRTPRLVFEPKVHAAMQRGINVIAEAVRPTLGPLPRFVAIDPVSRGNKPPKLLDNAAVIARRILELPDRDADMGAMLLRQLLWKQHEEAGDGTATTAVLFQAVFNEGVRYLAAGGNPMQLRYYLEQGQRVILDTLADMAIPLDNQEQICHLAQSICHDGALANVLGEIFDVIGEHGLLEIRSGRGRTMEREFVEGTYYKGGIQSQALAASGQRSVELTDAAIFISDLDFDEPEQFIRVMALAYAAKKKALVVVARSMAEKVVGVLVSVSQDPERFQAIAVKAPDDTRGQAAMLDDLPVLTGGRVFLRATGDTVESAKLEDLGEARRIWADSEYFGLVGGKGSARTLRTHITGLRGAFENTKDLDARKKLRERIGKLMGGAAILRVGGSTDVEITTRKENAERTAAALRAALIRGVLPGGGAALLACRPAVHRLAQEAGDLDERMACRILCRALEEPARAILHNAGYDAEPIIRQITTAGSAFDVRIGTVTDMAAAGVFDSAGVIISAVREALATAALALTVEVLVHHRTPITSVNP